MRRSKNRSKRGRKPTFLGRVFTRQPERLATKAATNLTFETLEPRLQMAVVINEFMAANTNGLTDQDGATSDWIELRNTGAAAVDVGGWYLTDDMNDLDKWQLPSTNIAAGGHLLVFASGKDRAISGQELHTNFLLEQNGESLALVMSDGTTVADSYALFPEQLENISYGRGAGAVVTDTLILESPAVRVQVPTAASGIDTTWYTVGFNDSGWLAGNAGVGFDNDAAPDAVDLDPFVNLNIAAQMDTLRNSAYIRVPFSVADPSVLVSLKLRIRYEDGFGLYLNGTRITSAERAAPASLAWNSAATSSRSPQADAATYTEIDLTAFKHLLQAGNNVLAIHGLNRNTSSRDFLIDPMLQADRTLPAEISYMVTPTPGAANSQGTLGFVSDTKFSVDRGFYESSFNVLITNQTAGATIRYTTDGSTPTATTGTIYNSASPPLITKTTTLRAAAFKSGYTPSNVDTQTYIFLEDVIHQSGAGLPSHANWGWTQTGGDWDMDPDVVNSPTYSSEIKDDLKAIPTVSLVMPWNDWFGGAGVGIYPTASELERPVSMEFFTPDGSENHQIDGGIEIQGGTSDDRWKTDKLSMRIKFKEIYGDTKFDADLFNDPQFNDNAANSFDTLILDAQINYTWPYGGGSAPTDQRSRAMFIQDQVMADLQNASGGLAPHGRMVHLYINGLYWGLYDVHERPDDSFAKAYLGGDKDDYDVIKHTATTVVSSTVLAQPGPASGTTDSAIENYAALLNLVRGDMTVPANYAAAVAKLDVDGLIDYMTVNYYAGNDDWPHHNWYASFNREDADGKWRFHSWDAEHVFKNVNYNAIFNGSFAGTPEEIHQRLMFNDEYRLRFTDRVQELMYNGGLLTPASISAMYQARMDEIYGAIVGESARWGDSHSTAAEPPGAGGAYTRAHWLTTQNGLLANYFPQRTGISLNQFAAQGWTVQLVAPVFSQYGGTITPVSQLTLSKPGGSPVNAQIYYTLDGSDPRDPSTNLPRASAILYNGSPISFADGLGKHVQSRIYLDDALTSTINEWSPLVDKTFLPEVPFPVRITEISYHPALSEDHEFFELTNTGSESVDLAGVQITQFQTDPIVLGNVNLAAGERIILAKSPSAFQAQYGTGYNVLPMGFTGNLSNGGEPIVLLGPLGETLQSFTYSDSAPWPTSPDGGGRTLEIIDPLGDPTSPTNWRASYYVGGSPGASGVPGDYNHNGVAEQSDRALWESAFGSTVAVGTSADGNHDGVVDLADYIVWRKAMVAPASGSAIVMAANAATETIVVASAAPGVAQVDSTDAERPTVLAVDRVFSKHGSPRPGYRPVGASVAAADVSGDDLLLASLASGVASSDADEADIAVGGASEDSGPIDQLFADWGGVADSIN